MGHERANHALYKVYCQYPLQFINHGMQIRLCKIERIVASLRRGEGLVIAI